MRLVIGGLIKPSWVVLLSSKAVQAKFVACLLVCLLRRIQPRRSFIWAMVRLFEGRWAYMLTAPRPVVCNPCQHVTINNWPIVQRPTLYGLPYCTATTAAGLWFMTTGETSHVDRRAVLPTVKQRWNLLGRCGKCSVAFESTTGSTEVLEDNLTGSRLFATLADWKLHQRDSWRERDGRQQWFGMAGADEMKQLRVRWWSRLDIGDVEKSSSLIIVSTWRQLQLLVDIYTVSHFWASLHGCMYTIK